MMKIMMRTERSSRVDFAFKISRLSSQKIFMCNLFSQLY